MNIKKLWNSFIGISNDPRVKTLSFGLGGYRFIVDEKYFSYQSVYAKSFRILKKDIDSVSLDEASFGRHIIKINGKGTLLASVVQPKPYAEQVQDFVIDEIIAKKGDI